MIQIKAPSESLSALDTLFWRIMYSVNVFVNIFENSSEYMFDFLNVFDSVNVSVGYKGHTVMISPLDTLKEPNDSF